MDQLAIEGGYSEVFAKDKFEDFEQEYKRLDLGKGHLVAYEFLAQIYKGQDRKKWKHFLLFSLKMHFRNIILNKVLRFLIICELKKISVCL